MVSRHIIGLARALEERRRALRAWRAGRTAPGPSGHVIWGSWPELRRDGFYPLLRRAWREHGDLACLRIGDRIVHLVVRPEHVVHVLVDHRANYTKAGHRARALIGDSLPASTGSLWRRQRRLFQPFFTARGVRHYGTRGMHAAALRMVERFAGYAASGEPVDVAREMFAVALDAITRTITGHELGDREQRGLRRAMDTAVASMAARTHVLRVPLAVPTPGNRRFHRARARVYAFVADMIRARRQERGGDDDMLSTLLDAQPGSGMSDRLLRAELVTMFLAGHETTARALAFTWYLLGEHPAVQEEASAALARHLGGRLATAADGDGLPGIEAIFAETLRLYPPNWVFPRRVVDDDTLSDYLIPAGSTVMLCPYLTQRHPELWSAPDEFRPERFIAEPNPARGTYYPFGLGPRVCIGARFAMVEALVFMSALLQNFRLKNLPGRPLERDFGTLLRPRGGLWMTVEKRP